MGAGAGRRETGPVTGWSVQTAGDHAPRRGGEGKGMRFLTRRGLIRAAACPYLLGGTRRKEARFKTGKCSRDERVCTQIYTRAHVARGHSETLRDCVWFRCLG